MTISPTRKKKTKKKKNKSDNEKGFYLSFLINLSDFIHLKKALISISKFFFREGTTDTMPLEPPRSLESSRSLEPSGSHPFRRVEIFLAILAGGITRHPSLGAEVL